MDIADTEALLAGIETALTSILSNFDPATPLDMRDGVLLTLEPECFATSDCFATIAVCRSFWLQSDSRKH